METIKNIKLPDGNTYAIEDTNALTKQQITNCITEIPQDIKLELNDGVLTLKAGSELTYADGRTITVASDFSQSQGVNTTRDKLILVYDNTRTTIGLGIYIQGSNATSGTTPPSITSGTVDYIWFDTNENKMKVSHDTQATWKEIPLPIGVVSVTPNAWTSIDQTFNGFGYIGSTVFVTKGVKGLIPNGRNDDGTLRNIEYTTDKVITETYGSTINADTYRYLVAETSITGEVLGGSTFWSLTPEYINSSVQPPTKNYTLWYDTKNNVHKRCINLEWHNVKVVKFAEEVITSGQITSFTPKLPFRAVDYSDKSEVSGWAMPSNKHIDLTLGASGTTYTVPANGWVYFARKSTAANQFIQISRTETLLQANSYSSASGQHLKIYAPARRGEVIKIDYNAAGDSAVLRIYYTQGEV